MDDGASEVLPMEPSEEHFCLSLRNGLILCNVLNKVNPGAIPKVVEIPIIDTDGTAQTAIQYFENMRNFLVAVGQMKLLTFEVSDLEKGGSSGKVVDCILCLKGFHEWRQSGGVGVWKYGGTVRITSFPKGSPSSLIGSESADESLDESESSQFEELLEYLHLSSEVSLEESKVSTALTFLFDRLGIGLLQAYLSETNELDDFPLNSMVIDMVLRKAVKDLSALLISQGNKVTTEDTTSESGPDITTEDTWGVNYRALRDLFQLSEARKGFIKYEVGVQMIEIYNEQVRDLLVIDGSNRRLDIRNNSQLNGLNVPDASLVPVKCTQDVLDLMRIGHRNRAVGATALNERSSRSHSVLTVHIRGKELVSGSTLKGCLHLVDLAGSERVDKSEAVGERLKEAQHINRSLSALGDVISALAQKSTHIPYRNSKLTQVLQDSLGGHAKTLMFVHINPETNAIGETISTLKFAERVASIELGAAKSNKETDDIREMKEEISNMKLLLEKKEAELEQLRSGNARAAISPVRTPRCNPTNSFRPEANQRNVDENKPSEVRSCSSGKQRRTRFPSKFTDKEFIPRMPLLAEEGSESPPIRRSISTDRGAHIKHRIKPDIPDNPAITKSQYPTRAFINRSLATLPVIPSTENKKGYLSSQDNFSEALHNHPRINSRKANHEQEEEQFKQMLNVRHGGVGKVKLENNQVKAKSQVPVKIHKSDLIRTVYSDMDGGETIEEGRRSDFSETENENGSTKLHIPNGMKKLQRSSSRSSHNVEVREPGRNENKPSNGTKNGNEGSNTSIPKFRRSRSTPRGKFMVLP